MIISSPQGAVPAPCASMRPSGAGSKFAPAERHRGSFCVTKTQTCFLQNVKIWRAVATPVFDVFIVMIALQNAIMALPPLGHPAPFLFMLLFITWQLYIGTSEYMANGLAVFPVIKWAVYMERWIYG